MSRFLRCFVVCLVMLTLPFQGASAAVMALSMSADGAMASTQAEVAAMPMAGCHEMPAMAGAMTDHPLMHEHGLPAKSKVCGNCCSGVMLDALQVPMLAQPLAGNVYLSWRSLEPEGVIPEGLERPPRLIS